jgi:hypothetical protein
MVGYTVNFKLGGVAHRIRFEIWHTPAERGGDGQPRGAHVSSM